MATQQPTGDQVCPHCHGWAVLCHCDVKEREMKNESEQQNTASQEIEVARRLIASTVTKALDENAIMTPDTLLILATTLEKIR